MTLVPTHFTRQLLAAILGLFLPLLLAAQPTFINEIPIPPLVDAADGIIELEMQKLTHKFNPGDPTDTLRNGNANQNGIEAWAYNIPGQTNMTFLAPTLKWHTGQMTQIRVTNKLPQSTTTHWHGAEVPAELDGGPHQPIAPDMTWPVDFINLDSASTMWFHPHFHNNTYPQVQLGLSGMVISEQASDIIRTVLPVTYGVDDFPVIIGDQQTMYDAANRIVVIDTAKSKRPINLVNGVTNPYLEVPAHLIRLRVLNGSTRKGLQIGLSESYGDAANDGMNVNLNELEDFVLIATDGGYTTKADTLKTLLMGPGSRAEIVLDLTGYVPGDVLYLRNLKWLMDGSIVGSPKSAPGGGGGDGTAGNAFLQIRIVGDAPNTDYIDVFTPYINDWDPAVADTTNITRRRTKKLTFTPKDPMANPPRPHNAFTIDLEPYSLTTINDTICEGAKEIWTIENTTAVAHPFHIHKIFFRILDIDSLGTMIDLAARGLNGPKDDVLIRPNWKLRFLAAFDDYPNPIVNNLSYMYHCHILTHEDAEGGGMMHQFVVTNDPACFPVGTDDVNPALDMTLFPNPSAYGELYLRGTAGRESTVRITDLNGRVLRTQRLPAFTGDAPVDVSGFSSGVYIVSWHTQAGMATRKVIIH